MVSSGMLRRVALVTTDVSEEPSASFIRVTRIGELGATQALTSNRRTLRKNTSGEISYTEIGLTEALHILYTEDFIC
jgi:demethoxyubiquinone hydroxylase (CLK1/Coq7/Cat5 family)